MTKAQKLAAERRKLLDEILRLCDIGGPARSSDYYMFRLRKIAELVREAK